MTMQAVKTMTTFCVQLKYGSEIKWGDGKWVWRQRHGYCEPPSSSPQTISYFLALVAYAICTALFVGGKDEHVGMQTTT